ncbi:class I SAM-dependent methyltransferase [Skermanella rosea]|uniref:class I SAM-dependent methyltransferase n=1 Tax=Skermanella rosea TaxID=1817965 RepID=UPI0019344EBE|nr:class I SAM-dependent methyltransferase [Skermanella rosea]UEM03549.1 class I SAM-dependent methyltransferase [Skermanella rosea]
MSRLDSFIRRVSAQRDCLNAAADLIRDVPGPVLEFGLGNGRTYDHLRSLLPERTIFVFERQVAAHPDCIPPAECLLLGDLFETLDTAGTVIGAPAALAHVDIGSGDPGANAELAAFLAPRLHKLMARGGVVVSDQDLGMPRWEPLRPPETVRPGRYFMMRV